MRQGVFQVTFIRVIYILKKMNKNKNTKMPIEKSFGFDYISQNNFYVRFFGFWWPPGLVSVGGVWKGHQRRRDAGLWLAAGGNTGPWLDETDFYGPVFRTRSGVKCYFMCHRDFRPSINITAQIRQNSSDLKLLLIGSKTIFKLSTFSFKLREKL